MHAHRLHIDRFFLITLATLTLSGFVIFLSASLGLLIDTESNFTAIALKQSVSLCIGIVAFFCLSRIKYQYFHTTAFFILLGAIAINLLIFIPSLALHHGGASRWIDLGFISFQPSEFLKIAFIIYLAAWVRFAKDKIKTFKHGLVPYLAIMAVLSTLLLVQSDTDTLVIIGFTGIVMLIIAGLPLRHIAIALGLMAVLVVGVIYVRPYAYKRVQVFFNRGADVQGAGYQINQSLIAIGSGGFAGKGFGQSVQKFGYLPEPIGDSIFAVAAEEFGFIGSILLLSLYVLLAASIFRIGIHAPDIFGSLVAIGIAVLITTESFLNMAAMLGLVPLFGVPLLFVSHGGTALIIALMATGIVANISKYGKKS
ncbi:MAG: putative peptidoglycan glycosyltransferase FtsW [Patescibacteria group bacterium]